jgi:phosphoserine phosphatase RsbU/P
MAYTLSLLMRRFFYMYGAAGVLCFFIFYSYNMMEESSGMPHRMNTDVVGLILFFLTGAIVLSTFTYYQLGSATLEKPIGRTTVNGVRLQRLVRFPMRLFWVVIACGVCSAAYYATWGFAVSEQRMDGYAAAQHLLLELSISLALGLLMYACAERWLRPLVIKEMELHSLWPSAASHIRPLLLASGSFTLITIFALLWLILNDLGLNRAISEGRLLFAACFGFLLSTLLIAWLLYRLRRDVLELASRILLLPGYNRSDYYAQVPVASPYETGELAAAFQEMQQRSRKEHEQLEKQLELAKQTQLRLLPPEEHQFGPCLIQCIPRQSSDVHGEMLDVSPLPDGRFLIMTGCVTGVQGLPAAVIMSAVLMLFRLEVKQAASASGLVTSLNRALWDTLQEGIQVSMTVGWFDPHRAQVMIASAGRLSCSDSRGRLCLHAEKTPPLLGTTADVLYTEHTLPLFPGEKLLFTAGVNHDDEMQPSAITVIWKGDTA